MRVVQPHEKFRLLIVNSDKNARRTLECAAEATDLFCSLHSMADGRFALEHVWECIESGKGEVPDIVITDLRVSGLDGIQLTREVRRYRELQRIFIAVIASHATPLDQDAAETAGCDFFIRRPKAREDLQSVLHSIANRCGTNAKVPVRMLY